MIIVNYYSNPNPHSTYRNPKRCRAFIYDHNIHRVFYFIQFQAQSDGTLILDLIGISGYVSWSGF